MSATDPVCWRVVGEARQMMSAEQGIGQQWIKRLGPTKKIARPVRSRMQNKQGETKKQ
jgi:hypothetical protein